MSGRLLLRWDLCSITVTPFLTSFFIPGLYSGIFVLHLQIHATRKEANRKINIVFHALWVLYLLSAATISLEIAIFAVEAFVSDNGRLFFLTWRWSVEQNDDITMTYHLQIAYIIVFGFCDFIAQSILVRTIVHLIYSCHLIFHRYTVAGLCGVAISVLWSSRQS
jgi:hypothetical protein